MVRITGLVNIPENAVYVPTKSGPYHKTPIRVIGTLIISAINAINTTTNTERALMCPMYSSSFFSLERQISISAIDGKNSNIFSRDCAH